MSGVTDIGFMTFRGGADLIDEDYNYFYDDDDDWDGGYDDVVRNEQLRDFFNPDISAWDTSSVTGMAAAFYMCYNFDQGKVLNFLLPSHHTQSQPPLLF